MTQFPTTLKPYVVAYENITVHGSTGAGNITVAPWIALFDRRLTANATDGYYVVYLFSTDMSTLTLSLAFGTTQFEEQFGSPSKAFPRMRSAATRMQEMFGQRIPERLSREPINLRADPGQKLHYAYQQASILSFAPYVVGALPEDSKLIADLQELVRLYTEIVSDPLEVTVERLVEAVVQPAPVETIEVKEFQQRQPVKSRELGGAGIDKRRYSPVSRKVGDAGEQVVIRYERERLIKLGRPDLADRIKWHGPEQEFCGWDVTSFDDEGNEFFIEVKSSVGQSISSVILTVNEWVTACHAARRERYYLYLVTDALSATPRIERMKNPASYVDVGHMSCDAIVYELKLRKAIV